jgi:hypothetical protein
VCCHGALQKHSGSSEVAGRCRFCIIDDFPPTACVRDCSIRLRRCCGWGLGFGFVSLQARICFLYRFVLSTLPILQISRNGPQHDVTPLLSLQPPPSPPSAHASANAPPPRQVPPPPPPPPTPFHPPPPTSSPSLSPSFYQTLGTQSDALTIPTRSSNRSAQPSPTHQTPLLHTLPHIAITSTLPSPFKPCHHGRSSLSPLCPYRHS